MSKRQELIDALSIAVNAYQRSNDALDDAVADYLGINRTDLRCLDWLYYGPMSAGQLAEATNLSSAAMTSLLDRLEAKGLVQRVRATNDRRKVLVEMTERGRQLASELYGPIAAEGVTFLEDLSDAELMLLHNYLTSSHALTDKHSERIRRLARKSD
jgi:DNA-binding MarR family transcriptional regulator